MSNGELSLEGFLQLHEMEAEDNGGKYYNVIVFVIKSQQDMRVFNNPSVPPVAIIYFQTKFVLFCDFLKSGTISTLVKIVITIVRDCGSAEWINALKC